MEAPPLDLRWLDLPRIDPARVKMHGRVKRNDADGTFPAVVSTEGVLVYAEGAWYVAPDNIVLAVERTETPVRVRLYSGAFGNRVCALGPGDRGTMCRPSRKQHGKIYIDPDAERITCGNCLGKIEEALNA